MNAEKRLKQRRYWRMIAAYQFITALVFAATYALVAKVSSKRLAVVFMVPAAFGLSALLQHHFVRRTERQLAESVPSAIARRRKP